MKNYKVISANEEMMKTASDTFFRQFVEWMNSESIENMNSVQLPCNVGDVVKYTDEYSSFEFVVEKFVIDSEEVRIYGHDRGCVVYARTFPEHCEIVR